MRSSLALLILAAPIGTLAAQQPVPSRSPAVPACPASLSLESVPTPPGLSIVRLRDVVALSEQDIWAVGYGSNSSQSLSVTMHFDGAAWSQVRSPSPPGVGSTSVGLEAVDAVASNEVYAAGHRQAAVNNASDNFALRWNGSSWEDLHAPGQSQFGASGYFFEAVEAVAHDDVWFGGQWADSTPRASMVHYDGSSFTVHLLPLAPGSTQAAHRIRAISALGPNDVWAAGSSGGLAVAVGKSYVAYWDGSIWQHIPTPHPGSDELLTGVVALASDDVWVSGVTRILQGSQYVSTPLFLHWNGVGWEQFSSPGYGHDLVAFATDSIYGVNGDTLIRWDGRSWAVEDSFANPLFVLYGVDAIGPCNLGLVGTIYFSTQSNAPLVARYR